MNKSLLILASLAFGTAAIAQMTPPASDNSTPPAATAMPDATMPTEAAPAPAAPDAPAAPAATPATPSATPGDAAAADYPACTRTLKDKCTNPTARARRPHR